MRRSPLYSAVCPIDPELSERLCASPPRGAGAAAALAWAALALGACSKSEETPAAAFCSSLAEYTTACAAAATPCDQAMVQDCTSVTGLVSEAFLRAASDCIGSGGTPLGCLTQSLTAIEPSPAHEAFVAQFCGECALGVAGCEAALLGGQDGTSSKFTSVRALILPLGDELVKSLQSECATGFGCLASFPGCAQGVLAGQAVPEQTLKCLLDSLTGVGDDAAGSDADADACGLSGAATQTTAPDTSATGGTADTGSSGGSEPQTSEGMSTSTGDSTSGPDPGTTSGSTTADDSTTGDACDEALADHTECEEGAFLPAACTLCTAVVCDADPFCCTDGWDTTCTEAALSVCTFACAAPGTCAHSEFVEGEALDAHCSDCVFDVCSEAPSCCTTEWNAACIDLDIGCGS